MTALKRAETEGNLDRMVTFSFDPVSKKLILDGHELFPMGANTMHSNYWMVDYRHYKKMVTDDWRKNTVRVYYNKDIDKVLKITLFQQDWSEKVLFACDDDDVDCEYCATIQKNPNGEYDPPPVNGKCHWCAEEAAESDDE